MQRNYAFISRRSVRDLIIFCSVRIVVQVHPVNLRGHIFGFMSTNADITNKRVNKCAINLGIPGNRLINADSKFIRFYIWSGLVSV